MKGGPSIKVLLDLILESDEAIAQKAGEVLKTQVFLYEAVTERLKNGFASGNKVVKDVLESYSRAEFFTKLPDVEKEIKIVTYIAAEGDISTDLLSPGGEAHSRSDRELHGKCMISAQAQAEVYAYLEMENKMMAEGKAPTHEMTMKWLEACADKFSSDAEKFAERRGFKLYDEDSLNTKLLTGEKTNGKQDNQV